MLNWVLSILVHNKVMAEDEAAHLSRELSLKTHPTNFADAHKIVQKVLKEYNENK